MKKRTRTPSEERKMKIAEAGILFALVLAVTVFIGVKYASHDRAEEAVAVVETITQPEASAIDPGATLVTAETIETVAVEPETVPEVSEPVAPRVVTYSMAEQAYFDGDFAASADLFNQYTDEHPLNAWGYYMLGLAEWKAGAPDVAEEAFLAALDLKPDHQKSLINYGRVLLELDRADEARQQLEAALAANPASLQAQRVLGRAYHNLGRLDDARDAYRAVLRTDSDDVWALNNLGLIGIEQEDFTGAVAPLARAAALQPAEVCIQNNLGVVLERLGQFRAAASAFTRALEIDQDYAKADESLARVSELVESAELIPVDLAVLAESFTASPAADAGTEPAEVDMEVATAAVLPDAEDAAGEPTATDEPDSE